MREVVEVGHHRSKEDRTKAGVSRSSKADITGRVEDRARSRSIIEIEMTR